MGDSTTDRPVQNIPGDADSTRQAEPSLSLIIPAYNEATRIADTIREAVAWLAGQPFATELIVVDDGSDDATADLAERALSRARAGRVLRVPHGGKAAAVRAGMLAATGEQIAFSDADLATPLPTSTELRAALAAGCDIAIGSREGAGARRFGEPPYRHLMGRVFNGLVRLLLVPGVHDTQCGFKLFRAEVAAASARTLPAVPRQRADHLRTARDGLRRRAADHRPDERLSHLPGAGRLELRRGEQGAPGSGYLAQCP